MFRNIVLPLSRTHFQVTTTRNASKRVPKVDRKLEAEAQSLAARGFLRPNKPYDPPADAYEIVTKICATHGLQSSSKFDGLEVKYKVLNDCYKKTGHSVPNSLLHTVECVEDLIAFYNTPVDTKSPFDSIISMELPKNLHVQKDYVRFHPDKDTLFNGVSAFPKSSTIVTGLKARKKYEGYNAKRSWP